MIEVSLSPVNDFTALGVRWRALEDRANPSFFQTWTWTGCLAAERFPDPVLLEATDGDETIALALFNRRRHRLGRDTLHLGETGVPALDRLFIEHNGPLVAAGRVATPALFRVARRRHDVVLSGINDMVLAEARTSGSLLVTRTIPAPYVDLAAEGAYLSRRSANTRQQIRRSDRAYAAIGTLSIARAETEAEAHEWLETLAVLHQATWATRGEPGCFAEPFFGRFHRELIRRGMPRHEIDLLRISAGGQLVGALYNFRFRGRALAYQSGFDYVSAGRHQKPGLTCHHLATEYSAAQGLACYDFLAGDDRYKRSLADDSQSLHWVTLSPALSLRATAARLRAFAARLRPRWDG